MHCRLTSALLESRVSGRSRSQRNDCRDEVCIKAQPHLNGTRDPADNWKLRLTEKYQALIQEIEEKKRVHAELRSRLSQLGKPTAQKVEPYHQSWDKQEVLRKNSTTVGVTQDMLNIVVVAAECAPYSKTGGLADVIGSLPKALSAMGHRIMVVVPRYESYDHAYFTGIRMQYAVFGDSQEVAYYHEYREGVDFVFVDHPSYNNRGNDLYSGSRLDVMFRCALLCKAALEAPWHVPCGGVPYGDTSLVYIANDWHAALLPVYLQAHYQDYGKLKYARSVLIVHNVAHQGRAPREDISLLEVPEAYVSAFELNDPMDGVHINLMKAALIHSHRIVAVSPGYAWECQTTEGGWGLDGILRAQSWKLRGIVNGIDTDVWNPATDVFLQRDGYKNYDGSSLDLKDQCKTALQRELGLEEDPEIPLLGFIGRLDHQKGVDLIRDSFDWLMAESVQLVLLGTGRSDLEDALREMERLGQGRCRSWVGFSVPLAHRITAGSDILLMPSRFEPCGLNQLYALTYGTPPVVHAVGGLRDTVTPFESTEETGLGWTFPCADAEAMRQAIWQALLTYRQFPESFRRLQQRGMAEDRGWERVAERYIDVLYEAKFQW